MTRPLIELDRFPSRNRKEFRASDLADLLNSIAGGHASNAAENAIILGCLEYKGSWPAEAKRMPALGEGNWRDVLTRLIEISAPWQDYRNVAADDNVEVDCFPHVIEICLNPLGIVLVWHGSNGAPKRRDIYGPPSPEMAARSRPYGPAQFLVRKSFLISDIINIAGDILRDSRANAKTTKAAEAPTSDGFQTKLQQPTRSKSESKLKQAAKPADVNIQQDTDVYRPRQSRGRGGLPLPRKSER